MNYSFHNLAQIKNLTFEMIWAKYIYHMIIFL